MLTSAQYHAFEGGDIGKVAAPGHGDVSVIGHEVVGWIKVDPAVIGQVQREPCMGGIRASGRRARHKYLRRCREPVNCFLGERRVRILGWEDEQDGRREVSAALTTYCNCSIFSIESYLHFVREGGKELLDLRF